jgi:hypothetical protein
VSRVCSSHNSNSVLTQRRGTTFAGVDSVPPNEIALYLSTWYCRKGRVEGKYTIADFRGKNKLIGMKTQRLTSLPSHM